MAIKGKGRTRSRRVIAAPPRPQLMIRKKPLWARRSTWIVLGAVLLLAVGLALFVKIGNDREERLARREANAVQEFANLVQRQFGLAQAEPLGPTGYLLFPTLVEDLTKLSEGDLRTPAATRIGNRLVDSARQGQEGVEGIQVLEIIPTDFPQTRRDLVLARFLIGQAFDAYERVGGLMKSAAAATGDRRTAIVDEATLLATQAGTLFDRGWTVVVDHRTRLGVQPAPNLQLPEPTPTG
jgi:hypothetical protein